MKVPYSRDEIELQPGDLIHYMKVDGSQHTATFIGTESPPKKMIGLPLSYNTFLQREGLVRLNSALVFRIERL